MESVAVISVNLNIDGKDNIDSPAEPSLPQISDSLESEYNRIAVRLPSMDKRKPLEKDAKDFMVNSNSDQQQQSFLNSTSSSSGFFDHITTKVSLPPSRQIQHVQKSHETSSSVGPHGRGRNQGIRAARQRFLLGTIAKQQEAKAVSEVHKALKAGNQTSEMSSKSSAPLLNRQDASNSSSSVSSTSQSLAQQKAAPQTVVLLSPRSLYAQNQTSFSNTPDALYNQSSSHSRPNSTFQPPLPQRPNDSLYLSSAMTGYNHRVQNDWANGEHLFIKVFDLPDNTTTRDLWTAFKHEGYISYIQLYENAKGYRDGKASVKFRYASEFGPCQRHCNN